LHEVIVAKSLFVVGILRVPYLDPGVRPDVEESFEKTYPIAMIFDPGVWYREREIRYFDPGRGEFGFPDDPMRLK